MVFLFLFLFLGLDFSSKGFQPNSCVIDFSAMLSLVAVLGITALSPCGVSFYPDFVSLWLACSISGCACALV
jgi:hypothetical protein